MRTIKRNMKTALQKLLSVVPLRNIIVFESAPDCSGSSKAVFDELIRRHLNNKYRMIWILKNSLSKDYNQIHNVSYVRNRIEQEIIKGTAKLLISENRYFEKNHQKGQFLLHIFHGGSFKNVTGYYKAPDNIDEVISLSPYLIDADAKNYGCKAEVIHPIGFPRNDVLLGSKKDLHAFFPNRKFNKVIYWLPTFRQHRTVATVKHSSISIPLIYDVENARIVNETARDNGILIVIKPHFAQDVTRLKLLDLSNLIFIDDKFLADNHIANYEFLRDSDAMLSDYSSVYYDYLLTDKPIGLCWEDFDEYKQNEGFILDPDTIMAGGEKIFDLNDLCEFIKRVSVGNDLLSEDRRRIKKLIFQHGDVTCTQKVADRVEEILKQL